MLKKPKDMTIIVKKLLTIPVLASREEVRGFSEHFKENEKLPDTTVYLDFSGIEFISRSAAAELVNLKESNKNIKIIYSGLSDNLAEMLRSVAANIVYPKNSHTEFNPKRLKLAELINR